MYSLVVKKKWKVFAMISGNKKKKKKKKKKKRKGETMQLTKGEKEKL